MIVRSGQFVLMWPIVFPADDRLVGKHVGAASIYSYVKLFEFVPAVVMEIIIMFIDCKWVDTRWQWSFNMLHMHGLWRLVI